MARRQAADTPRIEQLVLRDLTPGDATGLVAGADLDGLRFEGARIDGPLGGATFLECELIEFAGDRVELRGASVLESRVLRLAAPVVSAPGSSWRDAELIESRVGALDMSNAEVRRLVVEGSKIGWINLRGSVVQDVVFRHCAFEEVDLGMAKTARVAFEGCTTDKLTLTQRTGAALDLRGLEFRALEGFEGLRGAILSPEQVALMAETFAGHFGVSVRE
ncbi:pentapeptide repeat-containing protein [Leucobacter komagatae]|uniref:pentapeptide repeat-containing protein n=1 Tax=Leucobacter komagatae TaxID=55969 RepID=UPI00114F3AC0|nr:pentapeptide repeat-containing protein [Leucobacter komagatae]